MTRDLLRGQTIIGAICISAIICAPVSSPVAAADMPEPRYRAVEFAPALPSRIIGESERVPQHRFDAQRTLWNEPHGLHRNIAKVHLPNTTGVAVSPRPRGSQTSNTPPSAMTQKQTEQLFQEFLEWQKRQ